jgi:phosphoinositide-3-kinase regulatory subunit 4
MLSQEHDSSYDPSKQFGPRVRQIPVKRRNNPRQTFSHRHKSDLRDNCQLIATLASHSAAINALAVAPDHAYFVSCSDDKTVKIWDTARLERNVTSKPRQTYSDHNARVTALTNLENLHCFASAADNGSIHIVRVQLSQTGSTPKYSKLKLLQEHQLTRPGDYATCLTHYNSG